MVAAADKKSDRLFKEDRRSKANARGSILALCAHGKPKAASCHEGEYDRGQSDAIRRGDLAKKRRREQGTDVLNIEF